MADMDHVSPRSNISLTSARTPEANLERATSRKAGLYGQPSLRAREPRKANRLGGSLALPYAMRVAVIANFVSVIETLFATSSAIANLNRTLGTPAG